MTSEKKYVLIYLGREGEQHYFVSQNLYLGAANLTDYVEAAAMFSLDEAERLWACMSVKDDWQIWSVRPGVVLDSQSKRHLAEAEKAALKKRLAELEEKQ